MQVQGTKHADTLKQPRKFKSIYISSPLDCGVLFEFKDCVSTFVVFESHQAINNRQKLYIGVCHC